MFLLFDREAWIWTTYMIPLDIIIFILRFAIGNYNFLLIRKITMYMKVVITRVHNFLLFFIIAFFQCFTLNMCFQSWLLEISFKKLLSQTYLSTFPGWPLKERNLKMKLQGIQRKARQNKWINHCSTDVRA